MILDYSEFVRNSAAQEKSGFSSGETKLFFERSDATVCPFCKIGLNVCHDYSDEQILSYIGGPFWVNEKVWSCQSCGWWRVETYTEDDGHFQRREIHLKNAILRKYKTEDKTIPVETLHQYLVKNPNKLHSINDKKMEELVASVFSDHYHCSAQVVGKSHDGGIDIVLVDADDPVLVQVKRRKSLDVVEPVSVIREFLGATLLKKGKNCIFVTTASRFSRPAEVAAEEAVDLGLLNSYELFDFTRFSQLMKIVAANKIEPWRKHLDRSK